MKRWGCNSIEGRAYRVYAENQLKAHELEVGFPDEAATRPMGRDAA